MQRRSFMARAVAGATAGAAVVAAPAVRAQAQIRWRLASSFPKSLDTIYGASEVFAKAVVGWHRRQDAGFGPPGR